MSGVEALARALEIGMRGGYVAELPTDLIARQTLAALSPADRLAIAGITEERLTEALLAVFKQTEDPGSPLGRYRSWSSMSFREQGAAILAALATPGTPEGGEL